MIILTFFWSGICVSSRFLAHFTSLSVQFDAFVPGPRTLHKQVTLTGLGTWIRYTKLPLFGASREKQESAAIQKRIA